MDLPNARFLAPAGVQWIGLQSLNRRGDFGRMSNFVAASLNRPSPVLVVG
jgi:hypothetical protein